MVTAAILAGGQARRLAGQDKSRLLVGGATILARQLRILHEVTDQIMIVSNEPGRFDDLDLPVVSDLEPGAGCLGGLYTAIVAAPTSRVLVLGCDMPFISAPFLSFIAGAARGVDVAVPRTATRWHPLCACYARSCAAPIAARLRMGRLKVIDALIDLRLREIGSAEIRAFGHEGRLLMNINTPEDLARARSSAEVARRGTDA